MISFLVCSVRHMHATLKELFIYANMLPAYVKLGKRVQIVYAQQVLMTR